MAVHAVLREYDIKYNNTLVILVKNNHKDVLWTIVENPSRKNRELRALAGRIARSEGRGLVA